jgi:antitoxin YefM
MIQTVTIEDDYKETRAIEKTMVTREDLDALIDSIEIISNPETMEALHKSDIDIKEGRYK